MIKLLFAKYKSKLERQFIYNWMSIVLWIIITVTLMCTLFKTASVMIYLHSQLKSLSWIDFSCMFNAVLRSLIHNASAIFCFRLLLWKFLSIILKSMMTCDLCSLPLCSFIFCYLTSTFSHIIVNASWFRTFCMIN